MKVRTALLLAIVGCVGNVDDAMAFGGRRIYGGHPYHNGYHFIPPASAWDPVLVRPPVRYGAPMYYFPESYLAPDRAYYPPAHYPYVSTDRIGAAYLSTHVTVAQYPR